MSTYFSPDNADVARWQEEQSQDLEFQSVLKALALDEESEKRAMAEQAETFDFWNGHNWVTFDSAQMYDLDCDITLLKDYLSIGPHFSRLDYAVISRVVMRWEGWGLFVENFLPTAELVAIIDKMEQLRRAYERQEVSL